MKLSFWMQLSSNAHTSNAKKKGKVGKECRVVFGNLLKRLML